jgi:acyl-coenzyme A thioesterase PaaI-like protein
LEFEASANPMDTPDGGVPCDIADAATDVPDRSTLAEVETVTAIELKINFFPRVRKTNFRTDARMVRAGRAIGLVECLERNVFDRDQKELLVTRASHA